MRSLLRFSVLVLLLVIVGRQAVWAGTPQQFTVQGVLRDGISQPIADGPHNIAISGWDDSTGGTMLWMENKVVQTTGGLFTVMLDGAAPAGVLSHSGQQYIQMQVLGSTPLTPRIRMGSTPSALLTTRMDGDIVTRQGEIHLTSPGSGDPDFDLLRVTANSAGSAVKMSGGDPDFDLLRIAANPGGSNINMAGGGDPDFDLLRVTADTAGSSVAMRSATGDPDFDLLRITAADSTGKIAISNGDPDFDLLRITGSPSGSSIALNGTGDPDFDLLRVSAAGTTGSFTVGSGDPDFDLLRITGSPSGSSMALNGTGDPDFDLLRVSAAGTTGSLTVGSGDPDFDLLRITGSPTSSNIVLNPGSGDPDFDLLRIAADSGRGSIAIDEPGVQLSIDCRETTTGLDVEYRIGNDLDGDGVPGGTGIAIDEAGVTRLKQYVANGGIVVVLDGVSGSEGAKISAEADSAGGTLSVLCSDGTGATLTVDSTKKQYEYKDVFPCGFRNVAVGTGGLAMMCTPGGSSTPDTAVQIDPAGYMRLDHDLVVGGNICAVGTIGACSDARYKTNVAALDGALAQVARIRGVRFNWRTEEFPDKNFRKDRDFGFIAQELKEVVPQVVTLGSDGYYSVDYGRLTPLLVEAVKELDAKTKRIDDLESRLAKLEALLAGTGAGSGETMASK